MCSRHVSTVNMVDSRSIVHVCVFTGCIFVCVSEDY